MGQIYQITTGVQAVAAAGAVTGTLDTSAMVGDYTIKLQIPALGQGKRAIIAIEDTANVTPFSDARTVAVKQVLGQVTPNNDQVFSWRSYELPAARFGAANTKFRVNVTYVDGTPGLSVFAWLEQ